MTAEVHTLAWAAGGGRAPLVPVEVDLRSAAEMPIDLNGLRDDIRFQCLDLAERGAVLLLHAASMSGTPSGSLLDCDTTLAWRLGFGKTQVDVFREMKPRVLEGWVLCADGRWYHPYRAKSVLKAWIGRQEAVRKSVLANAARGVTTRRSLGEVDTSIAAAVEALRALDPQNPFLRGIERKMGRWAMVAGTGKSS